MSTFILYTDGGSRGNPGPAAAAVRIMEHGTDNTEPSFLKEYKQYLGETTNNVAEYSAVIMGLEEALKLGAEAVELRLDSELVGKQLRGEYRVKDKKIQTLFVRAWNLKTQFKKFTVTIIQREQNQEADRLVNEALDEAQTGCGDGCAAA